MKFLVGLALAAMAAGQITAPRPDQIRNDQHVRIYGGDGSGLNTHVRSRQIRLLKEVLFVPSLRMWRPGECSGLGYGPIWIGTTLPGKSQYNQRTGTCLSPFGLLEESIIDPSWIPIIALHGYK
jgi:hypothetical protein